jgi:cytochrome bd-type quinol oxidase subunit 2
LYEKELFYVSMALLLAILFIEVFLVVKYRNKTDSKQYTRLMDIIISLAAMVAAGYFAILCYLQK